MICWLLFHSQTKMCSLTEWLCEFRMSGWLSVDGEATWCGHKLLYIWNYNEHQLKNSYLFAHIVCVKYMHTCLCKLTYDTCDVHIPSPEMGFSIQNSSCRLGHFSLQVWVLAEVLGFCFFFWDLACILCKLGKGKNEKLCCQEAGIQRLRDSAGEILLRECSL